MMSHCQIGKKDPEEPESTEPELASEPEESAFMTPVRSEADAKEPKEVPLESLEPEEESHGVIVVVVIWKVSITVMGAGVGAAVGAAVGAGVGAAVGAAVGAGVGAAVGAGVGAGVAAAAKAKRVNATNVLMAVQR